jgi:hypothetical protein
MSEFGLPVVNNQSVVVADMWRVVDLPDVQVWHVDLRTKYADVGWYGVDEGVVEVSLVTSERTLNINPDAEGPTILTFPVPVLDTECDESWIVLADCSRYTARVIFYRINITETGGEFVSVGFPKGSTLVRSLSDPTPI